MAGKAGRVLAVRVVDVILETDDARTLVLEPIGPASTPVTYRPGQFLTVRIPTDRPSGAARCYSLCSSPVLDEPLKITVKRTPGGYASNWLCDHVRPGSCLDVLRPAGTFVPRSVDGRILLFAAGSGITPVMSIAKSVLHAGTATVLLVYANRDERSVIFAAELAELTTRFPGRFAAVHWLESTQGLPHAGAIALLAAGWKDATAYLCGPAPFMDIVACGLNDAGVPDRNVHRERYLSLDTDPFADSGHEVAPIPSGYGATVTVTFEDETTTHHWPPGTLLLDALLAEGLDVPYSCREGQCSACACKLIEGDVAMDHNEILEQDDLDNGYILACQARARSAQITIVYDA